MGSWRGRLVRPMTLPTVQAVVACLTLISGTAAAAPKAKPKVKVTWLGHATFRIVSPGGTELMLDPFITKNPKTPKEWRALAKYKPQAILVSHSHMDHSADAVALAKRSRAKVIGAFDYVSSLPLPDDLKAGGNVGGKIAVGDVTVHLVPAVHGSKPGGRPVGFIIELADKRKIYFTGDTWIFSDMKLIQEIYRPTIILLQCGGGPYNQDPKTAALALRKFFRPRVVIPMHWGTWPVLADEAAVKKAFGRDRRVKLMTPGQTLEL